MGGKKPTGGSQPPKPRGARPAGAASKAPANGACSAAKPSAGASNGRGRAATPQLEVEGLFEPGEALFPSAEGLFEPGQEVTPPSPLGLVTLSAPPKSLDRPIVGQGRKVHMSLARFWIALIALAILAFVVVASFVTLWLPHPAVDNLTRVLEILFAPLVALVGIAVAFYYYRGKEEREPRP